MMKKTTYILIISIMSIALIGIIIVQLFWIQNSMQSIEKQFSRDVYAALETVSKNIQNKDDHD